MHTLGLDIYQSAALGAVVLCLGLLLVRRVPALGKYCIPASVAGGVVFSILMAVLHYADIAEISFDDKMKDVFMMAFYSSVGFLASFKLLRRGGRMVLIILGLAFCLLLMQDVVGATLASLFGYDPKLGLCLGSISLVGGHGTSASYGPLLEDTYGIEGAATVAVAAATFGLAVAGFLGGPLAKRRVRKHALSPSETDLELEREVEAKEEIDDHRFLAALVLMALTIGGGTYICQAFESADITVPVYLGAMILGLVIRNVADYRGMDLPIRELNTLGWISLSLFLSMALMTLKLWQIADLAGMMVATLLIQVVFVMAFCYFAVFWVTGRNYDSAAFVTATVGFGLGATPNAMANIEALQDAHGPAPTAYFVVPLVGSVFIDLLNSGVLTVMLNIL